MSQSVEVVEHQLLGTDYLRSGNRRQQLAAETLDQLGPDDIPCVEEWALAGTVPLNLDLPDSDLDILVFAKEPAVLRDELSTRFSQMPGFSLWAHSVEPGAWCVAFDAARYPVEFFIQAVPLRQQRAFRHLVAEYALLQRYGDDLRKRIRALKVGGMKTEPAFAHALGLDGDPYLALLDLDLDPDLP